MNDDRSKTTGRSMFFGVALLFAATSACSGSVMMGDEDMGAQIGDAREELQRHHTATQATPSLLALRSESEIYAARMDRILGDMDHSMSKMTHCGRGMSEMYDAMNVMHSAMDAHSEALASATALEAVRGECADHFTEMSAMLDHMGNALEGLHCQMMGR